MPSSDAACFIDTVLRQGVSRCRCRGRCVPVHLALRARQAVHVWGGGLCASCNHACCHAAALQGVSTEELATELQGSGHQLTGNESRVRVLGALHGS